MRMTVDETGRFDPTNQIDAVLSRRSFVKSAALAAILGGANPQVLMAETKEGMPQRALGRTGEKVSAIGLGGYHIGKQADEAEDDGTNDLLVSHVIRRNELQVWFLAEHLVNVPLVRAEQSKAAAGD